MSDTPDLTGVTPTDPQPISQPDVTSGGTTSAGDDDAGRQTDAAVSAAGDDEKSRLLATIKNQREAEREAKAESKRLAAESADLKKKIEEYERAKMSDEEKRDADLKTLTERAAALERETLEKDRQIQETRIEIALMAAVSAAERNIISPSGALKLIDRSKLEFDDDGYPTKDSVTAAVDDLVTAHSYIVRLEAAARAESGATVNPGREAAGDGRESYSDRKARVFGAGVDPFDLDTTIASGGGVRYAGEDAQPNRP